MKAVKKVSLKLNAARPACGFTIAEVLVATLIVGMCLAGGMVAIGTTTQLTSDSMQFTKATLLAQEVREWSMSQNTDFADITSLRLTNGVPRDSMGDTISGYPGWTETIAVEYVNPNNIATAVGSATDVARITVTLSYNGVETLTTSWLVVYDKP